MKDSEFFLEVAQALSGCQLVEQQLKLYITEALELAAKCIGKRMYFRMSGEDYEELPIGALIKMFRKLNNNTALIQSLDAFRKERNFLSHQAITHCLDYEGELSTEASAEVMPRIRALQAEATRLYDLIHLEANTFRGHLWFEEFPD